LGSDVKIQVGNHDPPPLRRLSRYYFGLRILANAKALAGSHMVESHVDKATRVVFAPLDVNLDYSDFWLRKTSQFDLGEAQVLQWALQKDEETRSKEVELVRSGWPQGEALARALALSEVSWTIGPASQPVASAEGNLSDSSMPAGSARKRPKSSSGKAIITVNALTNGKSLCKRWNDQRGCTQRERDCPDGKKHACDVRKADGSACGSTQHNRFGQCPHAAQQS
jgi:hypothetical protein